MRAANSADARRYELHRSPLMVAPGALSLMAMDLPGGPAVAGIRHALARDSSGKKFRRSTSAERDRAFVTSPVLCVRSYPARVLVQIYNVSICEESQSGDIESQNPELC